MAGRAAVKLTHGTMSMGAKAGPWWWSPPWVRLSSVIALDAWELDGQRLTRDVGRQFRGWFANGPVVVWITGSLLVAGQNGKVVVVGDSA